MRILRKPAASLRRGLGLLVDSYAPQLCLFCDQPSYRDEPLCDTCSAAFIPNSGACPVCALPDCAGAPCPACQHEPMPLRIVAPFVYERTMACLLRRWKYERERRLVAAVALLAMTGPGTPLQGTGSRSRSAPVAGERRCDPDPGALVSLCAAAKACGPEGLALATPLHWRRRLHRGFNQSADLLHAARPRCPELSGAYRRARGVRLLRCSARGPQARATRRERLRNLRGAFAVHGAVSDRPVLLIDDVCTTGATGLAMATALRAAGARSVTLWCLARTPQR
jgi:predicted amidophosphoribosyltransferase